MIARNKGDVDFIDIYENTVPRMEVIRMYCKESAGLMDAMIGFGFRSEDKLKRAQGLLYEACEIINEAMALSCSSYADTKMYMESNPNVTLEDMKKGVEK